MNEFFQEALRLYSVMPSFFSWMIGIGYIIGISLYLAGETICDVKFHETGGLFGGGYNSHSNRKVTTKDMWLGIAWPVLFMFVFVKGILWFAHDVVGLLPLLVGFKYKETKMARCIDNFLGE